MNFKSASAIAATAIFLMISATSQAAFVKTGVIEAIDFENNTLVLESNSGKKTYTIPATAKVNFLGDSSANISNLEQGQSVKLIFTESSYKPTRGEVIAVNHSDLTAQIKINGSSKIETVKFADTVTVAGIKSFSSLRPGHLVTVR